MAGKKSSWAVNQTIPLEERRKVGTLVYTQAGLITLFFWMLWGDFFFTLLEIIPRSLFPLHLKWIGADDMTNSLLISTYPHIIGVIVCPIISFKSDHLRSRWGRRIPYIIATAPFLVMCLAIMGFTDSIRAFVSLPCVAGAFDFCGISQQGALIAVVGALMLGFAFFNEFVNSLYWYLFADVVPAAYLGRFLALFRMVGIAAQFVFSMWVFPHAEGHLAEIYTTIAVLYLVGFSLMCWRVKEGEYPPVPVDVGGKPSLLRNIRLYVTECFLSHRVYAFLYLHSALFTCASVGLTFHSIFARMQLKLSLQQIGDVAAWTSVATFCMAYPMGMFVDRRNPIFLTIAMTIVLIPVHILSFFYKVDFISFLVFAIILLGINGLFSAASMPMLVSVLPKEKYGQFCSANGMARGLGTMIGGVGVGVFLKYMDSHTPGENTHYRWIFIWVGLLHVASLVSLFLLNREWQRLGGKVGYKAPAPWREAT
jgi:hypothetical protein